MIRRRIRANAIGQLSPSRPAFTGSVRQGIVEHLSRKAFESKPGFTDVRTGKLKKRKGRLQNTELEWLLNLDTFRTFSAQLAL